MNCSVICMGTGEFPINGDKDHTYRLLDKYIDLGGNFIDTANIYGKWLPEGINTSELTIGSWLKERGCRNRISIGTKGGHPHLSSMQVSRLSQKEVEADLEESLTALKTDYIDLYWLHRDDEGLPVEYMLEYLNLFVRQGKIRYFGCSNWKPERIRQALKYAKNHSLMGFAANQIRWSLAELNENAFDDKTMIAMDEESYRLHLETRLALAAYSSQAKNFFGKLDIKGLSGLDDKLKRIYLNEENISRLSRVKKIASEYHVSILEIVLSYLISQPFATFPIIGGHEAQQVSESMKAAELVLTQEALNYLKLE